ncbi:hypothetical protein ACP4OV_019808 [Aristida adscensionis]
MAGGAGDVRTLDDPEAEPRPAKHAGGAPARGKEWWRAAGAAPLIACLMTLPFLVFFVVGQESASVIWQSAGAKLSAMSGGFMNASCASATGAATTADTTGGASATTKAAAADELLGGLLVPGFNRSSCLSRYEASQYFKHFPYKPSSHLLQKLRAYEARHRKCAPGTPLYAKSVAQLRSGAAAAAATECSYFVWLPFDGLGNRMLSMLSAFLYALLSGRVLLVALPEDSSDLFCEPFPGTTWRLPPDFPVAVFGRGPHPDESYRVLLRNNKIPSDPAMATAQSVPPYVYLSVGYQRQFMDKLFFCSHGQRVLAKVNWLLWYSDLYTAPSMYTMPEFQGEFRRLFPAKESVAHLLARYLFHPTNPVWGMVTRYYGSYLAGANKRIGVQIRMFTFVSVPVDDMYNQILACSRQENILPEVVDGNATAVVTAGNLSTANGGGEDVTTGGNLSTANGGGEAAAAGSTAILVASLYAEYYEKLRSMYYEHAARGGARVGVFQPTHEEQQATGKLAHNQKALAEVYLLSFSDELVTTGISTFGYISSSLAGVRPTMLFSAWGHRVPRTPCGRAVSMEPCNLTPPVQGTGHVECPGNKTVDLEDLDRHVKICEDDRRGVKLYD